jgi:hypothetical protein
MRWTSPLLSPLLAWVLIVSGCAPDATTAGRDSRSPAGAADGERPGRMVLGVASPRDLQRAIDAGEVALAERPSDLRPPLLVDSSEDGVGGRRSAVAVFVVVPLFAAAGLVFFGAGGQHASSVEDTLGTVRWGDFDLEVGFGNLSLGSLVSSAEEAVSDVADVLQREGLDALHAYDASRGPAAQVAELVVAAATALPDWWVEADEGTAAAPIAVPESQRDELPRCEAVGPPEPRLAIKCRPDALCAPIVACVADGAVRADTSRIWVAASRHPSLPIVLQFIVPPGSQDAVAWTTGSASDRVPPASVQEMPVFGPWDGDRVTHARLRRASGPLEYPINIPITAFRLGER